jgi:hypothetical protein
VNGDGGAVKWRRNAVIPQPDTLPRGRRDECTRNVNVGQEEENDGAQLCVLDF